MVKSRTPFPKEGEFIIGRVVDIQQQYIYVDLLDYEGLPSEEFARGMIHISEVSSRWIKNIRNYLRINQRVVLRVLRVDPQKGHIDLSLRRVNSAQRDRKLKEWKYAVKFENILDFLTQTEGISLTLVDAYEKLGWPVLEIFKDDYQETIENLKENGEEILNNIKSISEDIKEVYRKLIDENVEISTVSIIGKIKLMNTSGDGIEKIKESLSEVKNVIEKPKETRHLQISYVGAPYYRLEVVSKDYLDAENILSDVLDILEQKSKENGGLFEFARN